MASEMEQVHAFVHEMGDDVEVQWGISIDDSLTDKVRVTLIATGYDVSDIPGLDDAVGKKTVDQAIETFYGDANPAEQPAAPTEQLAASFPTLEIQSGEIIIDLNDDMTIDMPAPAPRPVAAQPTEMKTEPQPAERSGFAGWMRGRR